MPWFLLLHRCPPTFYLYSNFTMDPIDFANSHVSNPQTMMPSASQPYQPQVVPALKVSNLRQEISKERWEELRPRITRLYIDEACTLHEVAQTLAREVGFQPT